MSSPSLKAQMELLQQQQAQQAPTAAHRANGSLEAELPIMRRRRGRRKNVEGLELLFMANKRGAAVRCWNWLTLIFFPFQKIHMYIYQNIYHRYTFLVETRIR